MSGLRRSAALAVMRWSAFVLPAERREWIEAMRAEIDAIDDEDAALDFAFGCLWTSTRERVCTIELVASVLGIGIPAGLITLALFAAHLSGRHGLAGTQAGTTFGLLFFIFAAGAALFLAKGATPFARFAGTLVPMYLLLLFLQLSRGWAANAPVAGLFRALTIEGIAIWSALLLMALLLARARAIQHSGSR